MRGYRLLLRLYPASFRNEYGDEMAGLFRERHRRASRAGRIPLWIEAVADALATAPRVHADILRQDLRYTARVLSRSPGFAVTAVLVMALGIGATTAVFSVTDRVLLRPLPFHEPDRLVRIWENVPGYPQMEPSPANYRDWADLTHSFDALAAHIFLSPSMLHREPERLAAGGVTAALLPMLGVQPALGRLFLEAEDRPGAPGALILSDRLWRRSFAADPAVIGSAVRLDDGMYTIVGVMPRDFYFPDRETELWVTARLAPAMFEDRDNNFLGVFARLKPGVSLEAASGEMQAVTKHLERAYPKENAQTRATVRGLGDQVGWQSRMLIRALIGASGCLLLIACTNLASLLLTRFLARRREITVRTALGAGRERLVRQLLTESLVLSLAGGAAGVALAALTTPLLSRLVPTSLPVADAATLDARVLGFAAILTMLTGVAFGVLPAWRACRRTSALELREGPRGTGGTGGERMRSVLVVAQIAASILLLASAGLLGRALVRVQTTDPGFRAPGVLTLRTTLPPARYPTTAGRAAFYDRVVGEVAALPGVEGAAYTSFAPMLMRGGIWAVEIPGLQQEEGDPHAASLRFVTPGYFGTLGIPLRGGRDVAASDTFDSPFVAVVSESFARRYWPGTDPIGRRFTFAFFERIVVGIVGDVRVRGLESISEPQVYLPYKQVPDGAVPFYAPKDLLIRTAGDPMAIAGTVRRIIRAADPELPISGVQTMETVVGLQTAARRTQTAVLGLFAGIALLLAGVGLHGLLSFGVTARRREIGVRMALGAQRADIVRLVVGGSARLATIGAAGGLALAYFGGRGFEAILAGVHPADPVTCAAAVCLTVVMALSGSLRPTLRAVRVDPSTALRAE